MQYVIKKDIRGCHFWSDEEVVRAVEEEWVNGKDPDSCSSGLMALNTIGLSASY